MHFVVPIRAGASSLVPSTEGGSDLESESQLVIATRMSIETMIIDAARFRQREADYQTGLHTALQESLDGDAARPVTEAQAEAQLQSDLSTAMLASLPVCEGQNMVAALQAQTHRRFLMKDTSVSLSPVTIIFQTATMNR